MAIDDFSTLIKGGLPEGIKAEYISAPRDPGRMYTADFRDRNNDGVDDRDQKLVFKDPDGNIIDTGGSSGGTLGNFFDLPNFTSRTTSPLTIGDPVPADTTPAENLQTIFGGIQGELGNLTQESQQRLTGVQGEQEQAEQERESLLGQIRQFFSGRRGERELLEQELERFGVVEDLGIARGLAEQIGAANQQIASLQERKAQAIDQVQGAAVSSVLINRRVATQEKRYNSRINAQAAQAGALAVQLEAVRGNITQARAVANDVVNAAIADQQAELQELQFFFDTNESLLAELGQEERNALNQLRQDKLNEINVKKEEKQNLLDIMIQNPNAGVTLNDDIETALNKVGVRNEVEYKRKLAIQYPGAGIDVDKDTMSSALDKANRQAMIDLSLQRQLTQAQIASANRANRPTSSAGLLSSLGLEGTSDLSNLSPDNQEAVVRALGNSLATGSERTAVFGAVASFKNAKEIMDMLDETSTGPLSGLFTKVGQFTGIATNNETRQRLQAGMTAYTANFIKAISGAQVSDRERKFLMGALPSIWKDEEANREGLRQLNSFLSNQIETQIGVKTEELPQVFPLEGEMLNNNQQNETINSILDQEEL